MSLEELFGKVAKALGKDDSAMAPFISSLKDNWFETAESLLDITDDQWKDMKVPLRVVTQIRKALTGEKADPALKRVEPPLKEEEERREKPQSMLSPLELKESVSVMVESMWPAVKEELFSKHKIIEAMQTFAKLIYNIGENPGEQKFRKLRTSNKALEEKLFRYGSIRQIFQLIGFVLQDDYYWLADQSVNVGLLKAVYEQLMRMRLAAEQMFDPYQQSFGGYGGRSLAQKLQEEGVIAGLPDYTQMADNLVQERRKMMAHPPSNRNLKVYRAVTNLNKFEEPQMAQYNDDDYDYLKESNPVLLREILRALHSGEEKFANRRKAEFELLVKEPVFKVTTLRFKLPNNIVVETDFGPLETVGDVCRFLSQNVFVPGFEYHLFNPYEKTNFENPAKLKTELKEINAVPNYLFFVGSNRPMPAEVLSEKLLLSLAQSM